MMNVKEMEFNAEGQLISVKGTFTKPKKLRASRRIIFSKITNKVIEWAELDLEYCGG